MIINLSYYSSFFPLTVTFSFRRISSCEFRWEWFMGFRRGGEFLRRCYRSTLVWELQNVFLHYEGIASRAFGAISVIRSVKVISFSLFIFISKLSVVVFNIVGFLICYHYCSYLSKDYSISQWLLFICIYTYPIISSCRILLLYYITYYW